MSNVETGRVYGIRYRRYSRAREGSHCRELGIDDMSTLDEARRAMASLREALGPRKRHTSCGYIYNRLPCQCGRLVIVSRRARKQ